MKVVHSLSSVLAVAAIASAGCDLVQVKTSTGQPVAQPPPETSGAAVPAPTSTPRRTAAAPAATAAAPAPEKGPDPDACIWFPTEIMQQHEGGGRYAPAIHEWDLDLQMRASDWRRAAKRYAAANGISVDGSGATGAIDCAKAKAMKSDPELLKMIRRKKEDPGSYLSAQYLDGEGWTVDTNAKGVPLAKLRIILITKRGPLPGSIDLR